MNKFKLCLFSFFCVAYRSFPTFLDHEGADCAWCC